MGKGSRYKSCRYNRLFTLIVWGTVFSLAFILLFRPGLLDKEKFPRGDDGSYVSHAFTLALDFDIDYSNEPFAKWNKNHTMPSHGIGSGILAAPFVFLFSVFDRISGHPVIKDHNRLLGSWSLFGFVLSANVYLMIGIFLFWKGLCASKILTVRLDLAIILCLSTGVLYYVLTRATMSHAFEFFGSAAIFWSSINVYENFKNKHSAVLWMAICAIAVNMSFLIRYWSFHLFILPQTIILILYVVRKRQDSEAVRFNRSKKLMVITFFLAMGYLPLAFFFKQFFNNFYPTVENVYNSDIYQIDSVSILDAIHTIIISWKNFVLILFGPEFGVMITNPILPVGLICLWIILFITIKKKTDLLSIAALGLVTAYFGYGFLVVAWSQNTGMGYGFRHLLSLFPLAFLGVSFLFSNHSDFYPWGKNQVMILKISTVCLCFLSLISLFFFQSNAELSTYRTKNSFGVVQGSAAPNYLPNLFRHIFKLKSWENAGKKGYIGYLKAMVRRNPDSKKLGGKLKTKTSGYKKFNTFFQVNILLLFWLFSGLFFGRLWFVKRNSFPS